MAVHSTARGPSLGGCRIWTYADSRAAVRDALRLSGAMTLKSAVAGLPLGGGKGVIMLPTGTAPPKGDDRRAVLLDFGETVQTLDGAYLTAEDVGTAEPDMQTIAEVTRTSPGWPPSAAAPAIRARGPRSASRQPSGSRASASSAAPRSRGAASPWSASGASAAGSPSCWPRAARSSSSPTSTSAATSSPTGSAPAGPIPSRPSRAGVDVLAPCALGGVLDDESVPLLRARAIAGAANNQLAHETVGELLAARGILWVPDFVANAGGVVNIAVELEPEGYDTARAETRVRAIGDTVRTVLDHAEATSSTPLAAALEIARRRVAEAAAPVTTSA